MVTQVRRDVEHFEFSSDGFLEERGFLGPSVVVQQLPVGKMGSFF